MVAAHTCMDHPCMAAAHTRMGPTVKHIDSKKSVLKTS